MTPLAFLRDRAYRRRLYAAAANLRAAHSPTKGASDA